MLALAGEDWVGGLDLGQAADPSALAVLRRRQGEGGPHYLVALLERFELGLSYTAQAARVAALFEREPLAGSPLAVDETGVGKAVVDFFRAGTIRALLRPILITAGHKVSREGAGWHVPKKELVSCLQALLQGRRLKVARGLHERQLLAQELENFRVKVTAAANETFGAWREGEHDDLVLAVALAAWLGENASASGPVVTEERPATLRGAFRLAQAGPFPERW
jgi:hypothetical protein